jgi:competence protein ComFC
MTGRSAMRNFGLLRTFTRALQPALDLLYPPRCAACVTRLPSPATADFCQTCESLLEPITGPRCQICSEPYTGQFADSFSCPNCAGQTYAFDFAITSWQCTGPLREAVHRYKYGKCLHLRLPLAVKLHDTFSDPRFPSGTSPAPAGPENPGPTAPWLIIPVPLHSRRFRERRFNQSLELANTLSRLSGIPCHDLLQRTRYTTAQAALNRQQRLKNLAGAFCLKPRTTLPPHAGILLIDDVFTTGSTAHECALALKKAGATRIIVLTVARG